ncbi:hypothetical protein VPH35_098283 [Triticum aestivum]
MEGLSQALMRSNLPVMVELDSLQAVRMIQSGDNDRSVYSSLVEEIKLLLNLHRASITDIRRSQHKVGNCLAIFACVEGKTMIWLGSGPPREAIELNNVDCNPLLVE